jgi:hypothetical protein
MVIRLVAGAAIILLHTALAFAQAEKMTFTLYRTSPVDASMRLHVATFDAMENENYNRENCLLAANLFAAQPGVRVRYFCEKGRFRP